MSFLKLTGSTADTFLEYIERNLPEGLALKVTKVNVQCYFFIQYFTKTEAAFMRQNYVSMMPLKRRLKPGKTDPGFKSRGFRKTLIASNLVA